MFSLGTAPHVGITGTTDEPPIETPFAILMAQKLSDGRMVPHRSSSAGGLARPGREWSGGVSQGDRGIGEIDVVANRARVSLAPLPY